MFGRSRPRSAVAGRAGGGPAGGDGDQAGAVVDDCLAATRSADYGTSPPASLSVVEKLTADKWVWEDHHTSQTVSPEDGYSLSSTATHSAERTFGTMYSGSALTAGYDSTHTHTRTSDDLVADTSRLTKHSPPGASYTLSTYASTASSTASVTLSGTYHMTASAASGSSSSTSGGTSTEGRADSNWERHYSSATYTLSTVTTPGTVYTTRTEQATADQTSQAVESAWAASTAGSWTSTSVSGSTESQTATHSVSEHLKEQQPFLSPSATQEYISRSEAHSFTLSRTETSDVTAVTEIAPGTFSWGASDHAEGESRHTRTLTATESGSWADVTATTDVTASFTLREQGTRDIDGDSTYSTTQSSTDTYDERVRPQATGTQQQTDATSAHDEFSSATVFYDGSGDYDSRERDRHSHSVRSAVSLVGSQTQSLSATDYTLHLYYKEFLYTLPGSSTWFENSAREYEATATTTGWLDTAGQFQTDSDTSVTMNANRWAFFEGDYDSAFIAFMQGFTQALVQAAALAFVIAAGVTVMPALLPVAVGVGIPFGFELGQALYGVITGHDPDTGRELSDAEWANLLGGVLGGLVGGMVGGFLGARTGQWINGERCGIFKSCFAAGTPLLTPEGVGKAIETFAPGDLVLSRGEDDPDGPAEPRRVVETFVRVAPVLDLHLRGGTIGTTAEHPFYVEGRGWWPAAGLVAGDRVRGLGAGGDDGWVEVEGVADSGRVVTVYNLEVEGYHTYFVGDESWGFAVWAHNAEYSGRPARTPLARKEGQRIVDEIHKALGGEKARKQSVTTLTELEDGRLVVTSSQRLIPAQRAKARELLGDDVLFTNEKGSSYYIKPENRALPNAPTGSHAEGQGIQAALEYGSRARRQWSSSDAKHGGAACPPCEAMQRLHNVKNETGFQSLGGRFDLNPNIIDPDWNI